MNTLFKLRNAMVFAFAVLFVAAGCENDTGGGNSDDSPAVSLTGVSISGESRIAADGTATLTAEPVCTGDIPSGITYGWRITNGSAYASLSPTSGKSVTISGKNTTSQNKTVTVTVTASYNDITKNATHAVTVAATVEAEEEADLIVIPGAKVTTNGWADLANDEEGMCYPDTENIIYIDDNGYKVGNGKRTAYSASVTKRTVFTNAIASGNVSSASVNEAAAIIILSGMVDLSDGKVSDDDHFYFDAFNPSTHKREHEDIVYEIGSNKAIIGVNGARVAFGGLQIYANKCERGNIIIQNIDFWDAHGSTEYDTNSSNYSSSKASADNLVLESNGTKTVNGYTTYDYVPKNIWIDHCRFSDGTCEDLVRNFNHDGSLDMKAGQFVTVSYCEFTNHDKVTLLAPDDKYVDPEQRQITFHHNYYHGAIQRMPRSRGCQVHLYNNYYNDIGISGNGGYSLGPGIGSQFIVENNYFGKHQNKILKYFDASASTSASTFSRLYQKGNNVMFSSSNMATDGDTASSVTDHLVSSAPWSVGYAYEMSANSELPALIPAVAGAGKITAVTVDGVPYR